MSSPVNPYSNDAANRAVPAAAQLADARLRQWHQQGEALLTIENLRGWINNAGLVLFAPRPQIVSPAPSLVEAVLGAPNASPTIDQTAQARSLLARLVAEGLAVPLNLLGAGTGTSPIHAGAPGDTPDFVASTAVFSYIFTLRGDKAWKQPPTPSGALKVSPLALATHQALARRGPLSAYDLAAEVGKEVTQAAVLRSLAELWTHLRVLPLAQPDGAPTLWELAGSRFTKQIKAGANAGRPSALSALISLYLNQAMVASEDEIESFLSPLAARSRIREVIHALLSARQLDTLAVEGRTLLYVAGALPSFIESQPAITVSQPQPDESQTDGVVEQAPIEAGAATDAGGDGASRIAKFIPKPRKIGTGYLAKAKPSHPGQRRFPAPASGTSRFSPGAASESRSGAAFKSRSGDGRFRPAFKPRTGSDPAPNRERRPFNKPPASHLGKTAGFDRPWDEDKARRRTAAAKPSRPSTEIQQPTGGPAALAASASDAQSPPSRAPRSHSQASRNQIGDSRQPRKTFSKPGTFARKREGFSARPASGRDSRPPRQAFNSHSAGVPGLNGKPGLSQFSGSSNFKARFDFKSKPNSKSKARYAAKPTGDSGRNSAAEHGKRVYPKFDAPRNRAARPYSGQPRRAQGSDGPSKGTGHLSKGTTQDAAPHDFADRRGGVPSKNPHAMPREFSGKKNFGKSYGKPGASAGKKPFGKSYGRPADYAGKKAFGNPSGKLGASTGRPAGTFAKFVGSRKPFGKRPRKFKPGKDGAD